MVEDVDDDLTRELAFYNQVQRSASCSNIHLSATMWVHDVAEAAAQKPGLKSQEQRWLAAHQAETVKANALSSMQALDAAKTAVQRLDKSGKRWQRPPDYYAEMVKSDEHMARVKSQLMREQTQIAEAQER